MQSRRLWIWVVPVLLLSVLLTAIKLNSDLLFVDEFWSIRNSGGFPYGPPGIDYIWYSTTVVDPGGMGVLYHFMLGAFYTLVGSSVTVTRLFSLLMGLLAIAATYRLGREMFNPRVGFYAAAVLATTAFFLDFMHEARAYSLLALLSVTAIYCYWRIMNRPRVNAVWFAGLALTLAALAYTHYVALALAAALGLFHVFAYRGERRWWLALAMMIIAGLLVLPWLNTILLVVERGAGDSGRQVTSMTGVQIIRELLDMAGNGGFGLLILLGVFALRERGRAARLVWLWALVPLALVLIVNARIPFMVHLRYLMPVFPALALLVGAGIERLGRYGVPAGIILLVWMSVGVVQTIDAGFMANTFGQIYRAPAAPVLRALDKLKQRGQAGDFALLHIIPPGYEPFNYFVLDYYFHELPFRYEQIERIGNSFAGDDNGYLADVERVLADADAIWTLRLTELPVTQKSGVVDYVLNTRYARCEQHLDPDGLTLALYARQPAQPMGEFSLPDGARLAVYDLGRGQQSAGVLQFVAGWGTDSTLPPGVYSFGLHLRDSTGQVIRQYDSGLPDQRPFACAGGTLDVSGVPSGDYALHMVVYDWQSGERLTLAQGGDTLELAVVSVP
jgi:4-amino-4-deoxy-L-arabinose transferase-like glycosyltransferase